METSGLKSFLFHCAVFAQRHLFESARRREPAILAFKLPHCIRGWRLLCEVWEPEARESSVECRQFGKNLLVCHAIVGGDNRRLGARHSLMVAFFQLTDGARLRGAGAGGRVTDTSIEWREKLKKVNRACVPILFRHDNKRVRARSSSKRSSASKMTTRVARPRQTRVARQSIARPFISAILLFSA